MIKTKLFALTGASLLGLMMTANAVQAQQSGYLSFLIDNGPQSVAVAEAWVAAFTEQNPDVTIDIEMRPGGGEGDNIVKTRLATGAMADVFFYNSGSLFQALNAPQNLLPLTNEPFQAAWSLMYAHTNPCHQEHLAVFMKKVYGLSTLCVLISGYFRKDA